MAKPRLILEDWRHKTASTAVAPNAACSCEGRTLLGCCGTAEREMGRRGLKGLPSQTSLCRRLHKHLSHTYSNCSVVLIFDSSHSQAAFISICLDTIYYQLFHSCLLSVSLSSYLLIAGFSDGCRMHVVAQACESVCHPPLQSVCSSTASSKGKSVFLSLCRAASHVRRSLSRCNGLVLNRDLSLKSCGISSATQAAPTTVDVTLLLTVFRLSAPSSASSFCANTCMFAEKQDRKQTLFLTHACTKIWYVLLSSLIFILPYWVQRFFMYLTCVLSNAIRSNRK